MFLNSNGGSVADGFGIIDVILTSKTPVYTINQAYCFSMGYLIFLAGQKRYTMPSAEFLMHDGSTFAYDSTSKARDRLEFETGQLEKLVKKFVLERTNISEDVYTARYKDEWYMLPDEAKELGVCTDMIGKDCELDEIL